MSCAQDVPIIYLSSLLCVTDTQLERNALMADVYPKIKDYCREKHGLEFQVHCIMSGNTHKYLPQWKRVHCEEFSVTLLF